MLFCSFVLPLLLDGSIGCSCVLVNSLFSFFRFLMTRHLCQRSNSVTSVLRFGLSFQPQTPGKGLALPRMEICREFPHGEGRIIPKKNSTSETKDHSSLGGYIRKMGPPGWVRTWTGSLLRGLPHHQQCPKYLRLSLDSSNRYWLLAKATSGLHLFCQPSQSAASCHCQGTTWHHAHLLKALSTVLWPQPQQAMSKPHGAQAWSIYSFLPHASMAGCNHTV